MTFNSSFKRFLLPVLLLIAGFGTQRAWASHYAAVDLSLQFVGTDSTDLRYRIVFDQYKVCEYPQGFPNASLDNQVTICYSSASAPFNSSWTLTSTRLTKDTLDQLCPGINIPNSCRNPSGLPGFVRHRFIDTVTLPSRRSDWRFTWTQGARNGDVLNLANPSGQNIFVEAGLNNLSRYSNSTPMYIQAPLPYVCINQPTLYVNNPQQLGGDNDSMRTFSIQPRTVGGGNCPAGANILYAGGFSLANPVNSSTTYATSVSTGTSTFLPTQNGKFVLAYQTIEYDRFTGVQMGYISRDAQLIVLSCSAAPPAIDTTPVNLFGGTISGPNQISICAGDSVAFNVTASSNTIVNQVFLSANTQDVSPNNNSNFSVVGQGTANAVGTWTWQTQASDAGDYVLVITAKDSTCNNQQPIVLPNYLIVFIKVKPSIIASNDTSYCPPNGLKPRLGVRGPNGLTLPFQWSVLPGGSPLSTLSCTTCDSPFAQPSVTTDYVVQAFPPPNVAFCRTSDTVRVTVFPNNIFSAGPDQNICLNDTVVLQPNLSPAPGLFFEWIPSPYLSDPTILNPKAYPISPTNFVLQGGDGNGCRYSDTVAINVTGVRPKLEVFAGRDTVCPKGGTQLYSVVTQQACGLATGLCIGGTPTDRTLGFDNLASVQNSPFYTATGSAGHSLQLLYRREELEAAGLRAGYINSIAFNVKTKTSTGTFFKYGVFMGCTGETDLTAPSTASQLVPIPGLLPVYNGNYTTTVGWNTITFPVPYYWDGVSNLAVQICGAKRYNVNQGTTDTVFASNTEAGFEAARFLTANYTPPAANLQDTFSFCNDTTSRAQASSVQRPNTRFNVCSGSDYNYVWTPGANLNDPSSPSPTISGLDNNTTFSLTVTSASNANCSTTDAVTVAVDRSNSIDITAPVGEPFILCRPDYVQLQAQGIGPRPTINPACGVGAPVSGPADSAFLGTGTTSSVQTVSPYYGQANRTARTQMLIRRSELIDAGVRPGALRSLSFFVAGTPATGTFQNFRIALRCTDATSLSTTEGFQPASATVYAPASPVTTVAGWNEYTFSQPYNWDSSKNLIVELCYANAALNSANQPVQYSNVGFPAVLRTIAASGNACSVTPVGSQTILENRRPNMRFRFTPTGETDFVYTWYPGTYLSDSAVQNPVAYVPGTSTYYVSTQGRNNCRVTDSVMIYVPQNNFGVAPRDTVVCYGEMFRLPTSGGGKTFEWYQNGFEPAQNLSCTDCATPIVTGLVTTTYTVVIKDSVNCADTFYTLVRVKPLPLVNILQGDTTIKFGQSVILRVNGADSYYWTPAASLSAAIGTTVIATPRETTKYIVSGIATSGPSIGCRNLDSVTIKVDPSDNLFVPSAFSPNGDGVNDVFKVSNLTFQRLMEFRVYNRYGQEIFSTTDNKKGWDGTWKGVRQDMGVYQYMIRVAFPDGIVEKYQGDVTLIR